MNKWINKKDVWWLAWVRLPSQPGSFDAHSPPLWKPRWAYWTTTGLKERKCGMSTPPFWRLRFPLPSGCWFWIFSKLLFYSRFFWFLSIGVSFSNDSIDCVDRWDAYESASILTSSWFNIIKVYSIGQLTFGRNQIYISVALQLFFTILLCNYRRGKRREENAKTPHRFVLCSPKNNGHVSDCLMMKGKRCEDWG